MAKAKAIIPKKPKLSTRRLEQALERAAGGMRQDFEKTTRTWEHKVKFEEKLTTTATAVIAEVSTRDFIYSLVNNGTEEHDIYPTGPWPLRFPGTFTAKTVPGVISSRKGGSSGSEIVTDYVEHPGTEARNFDKAIAARWRKKLPGELRPAMRQVAKESGHKL